ncbi:hypothetical protein CF335_g8708 [Tilletia laevis]|nr:hypothetical protein CF335_g8708 [Tilletia laevis]
MTLPRQHVRRSLSLHQLPPRRAPPSVPIPPAPFPYHDRNRSHSFAKDDCNFSPPYGTNDQFTMSSDSTMVDPFVDEMLEAHQSPLNAYPDISAMPVHRQQHPSPLQRIVAVSPFVADEAEPTENSETRNKIKFSALLASIPKSLRARATSRSSAGDKRPMPRSSLSGEDTVVSRGHKRSFTQVESANVESVHLVDSQPAFASKSSSPRFKTANLDLQPDYPVAGADRVKNRSSVKVLQDPNLSKVM